MNTILGILLVLGGLALVAAAVWFRLGRSPSARWWVVDQPSQNRALLLVPGAGLMALGAGLVAFDDGGSLGVLIVPLLVVGVVLVLWSAVQLPVPLALFPGWARGAETDRRGAVRSR